MKNITIAIVLSLLLSGCSILPQQDYPSKNNYSLETIRPKVESRKIDSPAIIQINPYEIAHQFSKHSFVYRQSDYRFVSDYYNNYVTAPALLITEQSLRWFSQSQIAFFPTLRNSLASTHQLHGTIHELYIDRRNPAAPVAQLSISITLSARGTEAPLLQKRYTANQAAEGDNAEAFAKAISQALSKILSEQEEDIKQALKR